MAQPLLAIAVADPQKQVRRRAFCFRDRAPPPTGAPASPSLPPPSPPRAHAPQGEGLSAFVSYKVTTQLSRPVEGLEALQYAVIRRFSDFVWLRAQVSAPLRNAPRAAVDERVGRGRRARCASHRRVCLPHSPPGSCARRSRTC